MTKRRIRLVRAKTDAPVAADLTPAQIDRILYSLKRRRQTVKRGHDTRLPASAEERLRAGLPSLLQVVAKRAHSARAAAPLSAEQRIGHLKAYTDAADRTRLVIDALEHVLDGDDVVRERDAVDAWINAMDATWALRIALDRKRAQYAAPTAPGDAPDYWTAALLVELARWWTLQEWVPTTSASGAYVAVARAIHAAAHPDKAQTPRAFPPKRLRDAVEEAGRMRAAMREALIRLLSQPQQRI